MAYGSQSRTVQESVAPYYKVVNVAPVDDTDAESIAATTYPPCRGIMSETAEQLTITIATTTDGTGGGGTWGDNVQSTLTFADGTQAVINLKPGILYPFACTRSSSASVLFFY